MKLWPLELAVSTERSGVLIMDHPILAPRWLGTSWRQLKLAWKLNAGLCAIGLLGLSLGWLAIDQTIRPAFETLEQASIERQIGRAAALLENSRSSIESATKDYAVWDDSFEYFERQDPTFEREIFTPLGLVNVDVNAIAYVRFNGRVLKALYVDTAQETPLPSMTEAFGRLAGSDRFIEIARQQASHSDVIVLDGRLLLIGIAQVVRSDGSGAPAGYIVMAREFSAEAAAAALQRDIEVALGQSRSRTERMKNFWRVSVPIEDSDGAQVASLQFDAPRDTTQLGASALAAAMGISALVMLATLGAVFVLTRRIVGSRLLRMERHVQQVAAAGELTPMAADPNTDELGSLNRNFNDMIAQLRSLREQIEIQSFQLGLAESAAGVIHNVRNSLNPVTVILAQTLAEKSAVNGADVIRAIQELASSETESARRQRLAAFLLAASQDEDKRAAARREALQTARGSLAEALDILRAQNEIAHREAPLERFDVLDLLRKNAALTSFTPWGAVELELPSSGLIVEANRLLMSQVVSNLMTNAVEAIIAADRRPGRLSIAVSAQDGRALITITDNGKGFPPEEAAKLFERGHSSKKGRASGLGLHWCANTLNAMGGSLSLESDGPGEGARALLVVPRPATDRKDPIAA